MERGSWTVQILGERYVEAYAGYQEMERLTQQLSRNRANSI
jgi:hypothetical protein